MKSTKFSKLEVLEELVNKARPSWRPIKGIPGNESSNHPHIHFQWYIHMDDEGYWIELAEVKRHYVNEYNGAQDMCFESNLDHFMQFFSKSMTKRNLFFHTVYDEDSMEVVGLWIAWTDLFTFLSIANHYNRYNKKYGWDKMEVIFDASVK